MSLDLSLKNLEINIKERENGNSHFYSFAEFEIHVTNRLLLKGGKELPLTPKAVETLLVLVESSGQIVTKDELMQKVWPDTIVEESNLAQYIHALRKALGSMTDGRPFIETLKRRGYRFNGEVVRSCGNGAANGNSANSLVRDASFLPPKAPSPYRAYALLASVIAVGGLAIATLIFLGAPSRPVAVKQPRSASDAVIVPLTNGENTTETTVARDGRFFAYVDFDGDVSRLRLQSLAKPGSTDIIPPFKGRIGELTFSPDSSEIYFVAYGETPFKNQLFRIPVRGGIPTRIIENIDQAVSFSPDGSEIVFVRPLADPQRESIVIAGTDGSNERSVFESPVDTKIASNASWSPDGSSVAFGLITRRFPIACTLVDLELKDGSVTSMSDEQWDSCYRTAWTRDAAGIVFIGTKHGDAFSTRRDQVYFLERVTRSSRLITNDGNWHETHSLGITDDDQLVALPFNRLSQLWMLNANGDIDSAKQVTQGQSDGRGGIVARSDGTVDFLARDGDGFAIFETNENGAERRQIAGGSTMQELRAAPDGDFFVFTEFAGEYSQIFRVDRNGGGRQQLTFDNSQKIDSTVSPDGKFIVYDDTATTGSDAVSTLRRIPSSGGPPEIIFNGVCGVPHFSNSGQMISCTDDDSKFSIISAASREILREFVPENTFISNSGVRWSHDDKYLVYRVVKHATTNLWKQPINGGPAIPLTRFEKGDIYNFNFDPQGSRLYLARGTQIRNAILIKNFR